MSQITLSRKDLDALIHRKVMSVISEVMSDPDFGLELQDWVKKELKKKHRKFVSWKEVKKKYL